MIGAGGDRMLVLPREVAVFPVPIEIADALRDRRPDVEPLLAIDTRDRTAGDVPQVVAAAAGQPEPRLLERLEDRRHGREADVMDLHILARGQLARVLAELLRDLADDLELI